MPSSRKLYRPEFPVKFRLNQNSVTMWMLKVCFWTFPLLQPQNSFIFFLGQLTPEELNKIQWILTPTFESKLSNQSSLRTSTNGFFLEIGPRLNFSTALSTNACSICANIGLEDRVDRIEKSTLYLFEFQVCFPHLLDLDLFLKYFPFF